MRAIQVNAIPSGSTGKLALTLHGKAFENNIERTSLYATGQTDKQGVVKIGLRYDQKMHALFTVNRITGLFVKDCTLWQMIRNGLWSTLPKRSSAASETMTERSSLK